MREMSVFHERAVVCQGKMCFEFPSEPPVAMIHSAERRGAGKGARQRGEANPCRRAPFGYPNTTSTGGGAETFPLVSSELFLRLPCAVLNDPSGGSLQEGFRLESWRCNLSHGLGFAIPQNRSCLTVAQSPEHEGLTNCSDPTLTIYAAMAAGKGLEHFLSAPQPMQQHRQFSRHGDHRALLRRAAASARVRAPSAATSNRRRIVP